ncbi:hypothetical protein BZA05DRAFT_449880 [Tricharina praecox]|uniref:uncharacterized protein n=1 Tax=Tricharina praecox TaxID=43433 RepID=UPI00221EF4CC|nr:uncharacterized protein BZA05DRAFT_449880 [Tricharina praecox]KAI5840356.1 hypothetical protein BZA05DRAFT_449880 [Tricharina praecox]
MPPPPPPPPSPPQQRVPARLSARYDLQRAGRPNTGEGSAPPPPQYPLPARLAHRYNPRARPPAPRYTLPERLAHRHERPRAGWPDAGRLDAEEEEEYTLPPPLPPPPPRSTFGFTATQQNQKQERRQKPHKPVKPPPSPEPVPKLATPVREQEPSSPPSSQPSTSLASPPHAAQSCKQQDTPASGKPRRSIAVRGSARHRGKNVMTQGHTADPELRPQASQLNPTPAPTADRRRTPSPLLVVIERRILSRQRGATASNSDAHPAPQSSARKALVQAFYSKGSKESTPSRLSEGERLRPPPAAGNKRAATEQSTGDEKEDDCEETAGPMRRSKRAHR